MYSVNGSLVIHRVNIYNDMRTCLGSFNGLGVVRFGNDLRSFMHPNQDPMINVNLANGFPSYSVFAIAPELNHQLYEGDRQLYDIIANNLH